MASNPNYVKKQLTVDTVSWTAIVAPIDCMGVVIKNSALVNLLIRTDSGDATTQDTIAAGSVETIAVPRHASGIGQHVETSLLAGLVSLLNVQAQRHLSLGVAAVSTVCVGLDKLPDGEPIRSLFWRYGGVTAHGCPASRF